MPDVARERGVAIKGHGRVDYPVNTRIAAHSRGLARFSGSLIRVGRTATALKEWKAGALSAGAVPKSPDGQPSSRPAGQHVTVRPSAKGPRTFTGPAKAGHYVRADSCAVEVARGVVTVGRHAS